MQSHKSPDYPEPKYLDFRGNLAQNAYEKRPLGKTAKHYLEKAGLRLGEGSLSHFFPRRSGNEPPNILGMLALWYSDIRMKTAVAIKREEVEQCYEELLGSNLGLHHEALERIAHHQIAEMVALERIEVFSLMQDQKRQTDFMYCVKGDPQKGGGGYAVVRLERTKGIIGANVLSLGNHPNVQMALLGICFSQADEIALAAKSQRIQYLSVEEAYPRTLAHIPGFVRLGFEDNGSTLVRSFGRVLRRKHSFRHELTRLLDNPPSEGRFDPSPVSKRSFSSGKRKRLADELRCQDIHMEILAIQHRFSEIRESLHEEHEFAKAAIEELERTDIPLAAQLRQTREYMESLHKQLREAAEVTGKVLGMLNEFESLKKSLSAPGLQEDYNTCSFFHEHIARKICSEWHQRYSVLKERYERAQGITFEAFSKAMAVCESALVGFSLERARTCFNAAMDLEDSVKADQLDIVVSISRELAENFERAREEFQKIQNVYGRDSAEAERIFSKLDADKPNRKAVFELARKAEEQLKTIKRSGLAQRGV